MEEEIERAPQLPPDVKVAFYRQAQEALNNIVKHADAQHIRITLHFMPSAPEDGRQATWSGKADMQVNDDGRGFDPAQAKQGGLGLDNMRAAGRRYGRGPQYQERSRRRHPNLRQLGRP